MREWLSADVANYRRVMADNKADAIKQAEVLWKGKLATWQPGEVTDAIKRGKQGPRPGTVGARTEKAILDVVAPTKLDLCKTCDRTGRCSFEANNLVCKRIADAHFQNKQAEARPPEVRDLVMKNKKLLHDHAAAFQGFFKVPLASYMNDVTGFDIIKFDEMIKPPKGISTHDFVMRKYGLQALHMIQYLIGMKVMVVKGATYKPKGPEMTKGR